MNLVQHMTIYFGFKATRLINKCPYMHTSIERVAIIYSGLLSNDKNYG